MNRKKFLGLAFFGLAALLVFAFLNPLSSGSQGAAHGEKKEPSGVPITGHDEDLESKNPGKTPYVAPQPYIATLSETSNLETLRDDGETLVIIHKPDRDFRIRAGFEFGKDTFILGDEARNPDVAIDPNGTIYVAMEYKSPSMTNAGIWLMKSSNYGGTWDWWFGIQVPHMDLKTPSIAVGRGRVVVACILNESPPRPFIINRAIDSDDLVTRIPPHFNHPYAKPIIKADPPPIISSDLNFHLVAESHVDQGANNINIEYWRSADGGLTWPDTSTFRKTVYGDTDAYEWREPDIVLFVDYVSPLSPPIRFHYITAYRKDTRTIYLNKNLAATSQAVVTLPNAPTFEVYPRIAGFPYYNLMIVYNNKPTTGSMDDRAYYIYSQDGSVSWSGPYAFPGQTTFFSWRPVITADPWEPGYFHAIYTEDKRVYYHRRPLDLSSSWSARKQASDRNWQESTTSQKGIAAFRDNAHVFMTWAEVDFFMTKFWFSVFGDRTYPDDLLGSWTGQGVYFRTERGSWVGMATPATMITAGDLDGRGTDSLIGIWPDQGGVWVKYSAGGTWALLATTARHIATGDMNGDGRVDLLGTWDGQGVYYRCSWAGNWMKLATPADLVAAGDLDGDGINDLIGSWPGQGGVWVKYSGTGEWVLIASPARDITVGDMNGNGRDDLVGTWDGQGVYYWNSVTGGWVKLATPADLVAAGDLDGDGIDDLIGSWPGQGGVWAKLSQTNAWVHLASPADSIAAGMMRGGRDSWITGAWRELPEPIGGNIVTEPYKGMPGSDDLSAFGPGGRHFLPQLEKGQLLPAGRVAPIPGPGMAGFTFETTPNPVPGEIIREREKPVRNSNR